MRKATATRVVCPFCESQTVSRRYTTEDYIEIVGIEDDGNLVEGLTTYGDPNNEGLECLACGVPVLPHELIKVEEDSNE